MTAHHSLRKFLSITLSVAIVFLPTWAQATDYTWDPAADLSNSGGTGTWDLTSSFWNNAGVDGLWGNTNADVAVFGGTGGVVTINTGTGVTANGLTFNVGGYTIAGNVLADTLTLAGGTPTITVTNVSDTATINAIIAGSSGLTKAGSGNLVLGGANTYSGQTTINAGTVNIAASTNLGDASATNTIAFGGGTLRSTATLDLGTTRTIAVGAGGGTLSAQTATTLTVSGALSGSAQLTAAGGGTVVLGADNSGFSGNVTVNSVLGDTTNTTLRLSNANALTSGTVTVNAGVAVAGGNGNQVELAGVAIGSGVSLVLNATSATNARSSLYAGSGVNAWSGGIQYVGDGSTALNANTGATLNVNGNITDGGYTGTSFLRGTGTGVINGTITLSSANIAKTDSGTWTINTTGNSWLSTSVSVGTLTIGIADALPTTTVVTLGQNDTNAATFDLNGFNQTIGGLASNPASGTNANSKTVTSATAATLTINQAGNSTYGGVLSGALTIVKLGAGTLTLSPTVSSARTATNSIDDGRIAVTQIGALGTGAVTVTGAASVYEINTGAATSLQTVNLVNGGTLNWTPNAQLTLGAGLPINVSGTGGTIYVGGSLSTGKVLAAAGLLTSTAGSTTTKTGGGVLQLSGANTGFLGDVAINAGTIEFQNVDSLGTTAKTVTIGGTGDLATGGVANRNNIVLTAGGTLSANSTSAVYTGTVNVAGNANIALRQFQTPTTANSFAISGPISGGANLNATAPAAATLNLTGNNTGFSGQMSAGTNATVSVNAKQSIGTGGYTLAGGTVRIQGQNNLVTLGSNGLNATYFNFGTNPGIASTQFAGDQLYLVPRAFSRVDAGVNMPQAGSSGGMPLIPMPGYTQAGAGAVQNGAMWKGLLNITNAGTYQFKGNDDDNLVLYIDGVQIGTLGVVSALTNIGSAMTLSAGSHSIAVKHTNGGGGGYARVLYNGGAGSDAPADEVLGTDAGSVTTGSLDALALGPVTVTANSTLDLLNDATTSSLSLGNATLTVASQTLNSLTVTGGTITAATPTLAVSTNRVIVTGAIGESSAGLGLNLSGPGLVEFQGANAYTGTTNVTGGQLRLNTTGANALAGNLTVNSANANGDIANVRLLQSNQIADTATLTMTSGILDLGANNETVANVAINGGRIIGSGTLTVTNLGTSTLTAGVVNANLGGAGGLNKTGTGTLALGGTANSYTGVTTISNGVLALSGGTLGAGGAGNETNITGGLLALLNTNSGTESVSSDVNTGVAALGGTSTLGALNYSASATAPVLAVLAGGELILNSAPTSTANITKAGPGVLTFNYDVGATLPANVVHSAGALGFNVAQSFGAATIPAGAQFKFNVDPVGVDVMAPAGTSVIAGYAADQNFLTRINAASTGTLALGVDSAANLDFSSDATLSLGAVGLRTYSGTITPGASGYRLGGGGGELTVTSTLSGANNLTVGQTGTVALRGPQTFIGAVSIDGGGRLRVINNSELGNAGNVITLTNGGTLELIGTVHDSGKKDTLFGELGNLVGTSARVINVGTGGGAINVNAYSNQSNAYVLTGTDSLTGSGNLTKQGFGELTLVGSSNYSGNLTLAEQGGRVYLRSGGKLPNIAGITVNQSAEFIVNNTGGFGTRQFPENPSSTNGNRVNDSVAITLRGGAFRFLGNDAVASNEIESVGAITLDVGRNQIEVNSGGGTGTQGAQLSVANLVRNPGGGVLNVISSGTLGTPTGDASRIVPTLLNGAAVPASTTSGTTLPWATTNNAADFIAISVTGLNGLAAGPSTSVANVTLTPVPATRYTFTPTAAGQNLTLAAGNQQMAGLRFVTNLGTPSLRFTNAVDTLYLGDGVVIGDNNNQTRTIGLNTLRGNITSGAIGAAAGAKELFFHQNQNTLAVESVIVDNNGAVTVHKGVGSGTLELRAANTYSGGTIVHQGRVNAIVAGSLGSGPVTVKGSAIELRAPGTTTSTGGFTVTDGSELYLQSATGVYTQPGDRFTLVGSNNILTGSIANAGQGLASLTRVTTITGAGQVILPAGTHVRYQGSPNGVVDFRGPANLGTDADLYFNLAATAGGAQTITVGAGTPWKGLGSAVGSGWEVGTINANSDFYIQGLNRIGGNVTFALGASGSTVASAGGYTINNLSGGAINAFLEGRVDLNEDSPMMLPGNLTFVVTPGAYVVASYSQQFGWDTIGMSRAKVLVQAGGTLDPGSFTTVGSSANMPQGMPYPIPSPVNAFATFEAGSRFLINDGSGIGSTTGGATWTMKTDSIMHLGTAAAFLGSNAGLINAGQFVYEPGTIIRYETGNVFKHDQFINNEPNGQRSVLEIYNGDRAVTDAVNPFIVPVTGTPTIAVMTLAFGDGGMITNDANDRQINERRGRFLLNNGAILAGTTQTYLNIQESIEVPLGATVTIGSNRFVDGLPKLGAVQLNGPNSNIILGDIVIADGAQLTFGAVNVWPDTKSLNLPTAVTAFPTTGAIALQPGNGTSLLLNTANFIEYTGPVTGNGTVMANQGGTALGMNITSDVTSNVVFKSTNGQNPSLVKAGPNKLTLTGTSDSTGVLLAQQGEVVVNAGAGNWGEVRVQRGGQVTVDNSVTAASNRLVTPDYLVGQGGTFELIGHATTPVTEYFTNIASGSGNFINVGQFGANSTIKVTAGTATTKLSVQNLENFQTTGQRFSSYIINSPSVANGPLTYGTANQFIPNGTNTANGLLEVFSPNFGANAGFGIVAGGHYGSAGTPIAASRNDFLGDANGDGIPDGFMTEDGVNYPATGTSGTNTLPGLPTTTNLAVGMAVTGTNIPANTRIASIVSGTSVTLTNNLTGAAANLNTIVGGLRNLAASEYSSILRDNHNAGINAKLSGTTSILGDTRVQTLTMTNGSTLNINGAIPLNSTMGRLHLNAGGVFIPDGATATINGGTEGGTSSFLQTNGGTSLMLHTWGTLNLNAKVWSDIAVVKTGPGTLNVGAGALTVNRTNLQVDGGTVTLAAGNSMPNFRTQNGSSTANSLIINGGTLDLNGNSQMINLLSSANELPGTGGTVTSATAATIMNTGGGRFAGVLAGEISLDKVANNTLLLTSAQTYTGTTIVRAGTLQLRDSGALAAGTGAVSVQNATLQLDDSYLSNVTNRVNAATPISLFAGTVNITGAAGQLASQTFNTLTLAGGLNNFTSNAGGSGANEVTIGNLVRAQGPNATGSYLAFNQNYGFLGTAGSNTTAIRNFITNVNGAPLALNDNIIAGWAIATPGNGSTHFATYLPATGVGAMSNTADGYATYESGDFTTATATQNVNDGGAARTLTASRTINAVRFVPGADSTWTFNNGAGLTVDTGGFISDGNQTHRLSPAANASGNFITSNSGELDVWVQQNQFGINLPVTGSIDLVKSGGASLNLGPQGNYTVTNTSGTNVLTTTTTAGLVVGMPISGTGIPAGSTITGITPGVSFTISNNTTAAVTAAAPIFGNTYTGKTIVNGGTLQLTLAAAGTGPRTNYVAVPGDLVINAATVTELNVANQISSAANITIGGGGRLNLVNLAGVTETLGSLTFLDGSSATATANGLDRTAAQLTSTVNLTAATAITSNNTNPSTGVPYIGGNTGNIAFTNATSSTLNINSPTAVNGVLAVGLRVDSRIATVPIGPAEGGLIKSGTGLLVLSPNTAPTFATTGSTTVGSNVIPGITSTVGMFPGMQISGTNIPTGSYILSVDSATQITISANATVAGAVGTITGQPVNFFGMPTSSTPVLDIQSGMVRADVHGSLGSPFAITTVQSGAVLLGANSASQILTGSVTLKNGSTLGATLNGFTLGAATDVAANQTVLTIGAGTVNIAAYDYFVPGTNSGNITINGRLTGAGNINLVGQQLMQGSGGGGTITLGNPLLSGAGAGQNNYTGTITVGTNAVLQNQIALIAKNTAVVRSTGNALGSATINLAGGRLRFRDDATSGATAVSNTAVNFASNNVTLSENSFIDVGRVNTADTNSGNIIDLGTLTVSAGTKSLTVDSNTATTAAAGAGNYITRFASIDGAGTLVKAGAGRLQFNAIAGTFTGGINIAGPQGVAIAPNANTTTANLLLPTSATLPNFSVNGMYITEASKTLNVTGTLAVNTNPGDVLKGQANVAGRIGVQNTTTITAGTITNNGVIGPIGGAVTLTASSGFTGTGTYVTTNATSGATSSQALTLAGNFSSGTLRTAGLNTVSITGAAHTPTATEVQSGTLKVAPAASAATTGTVTVFGSPASTAGASTAPISAVTGTLDFAAAAGAVTHTGNVTNSGIVKVSAGTATVTGAISGSATLQYAPGLLEGLVMGTTGFTVDNTRPANPGNFGIQMEPRMLQNNSVTQQAITGHLDNEVWVYTGYVKDDDGVFSFAGNQDDNLGVWIDGTLVLNSSGNVVGSTAYKGTQSGNGAIAPTGNSGTPSQNFGPGIALPGYGTGWHLVEIRMRNGAGGAGPWGTNGFITNYGFGYKNGIGALDGADYIKPIDDGTGALFVTPVGSKGEIAVDSGATLNVASFSQTSRVTLGGGAGAGVGGLNITVAGASSADEIFTAAGKQGQLTIPSGSTVTTPVLKVGADGLFTLNGAGRLTPAAITLQGTAVNAVGKATFAATGVDAVGGLNSTTRAGSLTIDNDGAALGTRGYYATLDLKNNDLVIDNTTPANDSSPTLSQLANVSDMVRSGSTSSWTGKGITSSYIATQTPNLNNGTALGTIRNVLDPTAAFGGGNTALYPTFDGYTLPGNETLVKYTYYGDADLDGKLTSFDFALLDAGFAGTKQLDNSSGWFFGDFDYNGLVDANDYALMNAGYVAYTTGGGAPAVGANTQLPEPGSFILSAFGLVGLLAAYRRRRQLGK